MISSVETVDDSRACLIVFEAKPWTTFKVYLQHIGWKLTSENKQINNNSDVKIKKKAKEEEIRTFVNSCQI